MEVKELIKKVKQLELKTKKQSTELFSGNYASKFKGRGMSFSEVRKYSYGDDIRNIDWNVTSRSQEPYVKEFEEERELNWTILVDVSPSTLYGSGSQNKREIISEIAATIAFSALKHNDKVGVIFFSDRIEKYIPPKKGRPHILTIIRELIEVKSPQNRKTDIGEALRFLQNTIKKKSVVILLSDFLDTQEYETELSIANIRHQFYAIQVQDEIEADIPNLGVIKMYNPETQEDMWVDTSSSFFKKLFSSHHAQNHEVNRKMFEKLGNKYCTVSVQKAYIPTLARMFGG